MDLKESLEAAVDQDAAPAVSTEVVLNQPETPKRTKRKVTKVKREKPKPKKEPYLFVMHEYRIDKFNVLRERRLLTPVTCEHCGWDACLDNDLEPFWEIDENGDYIQQYTDEEAKLMKGALAAHVKQFHDISQQKVIAADDIPTAWLGPPRKKRSRKRK